MDIREINRQNEINSRGQFHDVSEVDDFRYLPKEFEGFHEFGELGYEAFSNKLGGDIFKNTNCSRSTKILWDKKLRRFVKVGCGSWNCPECSVVKARRMTVYIRQMVSSWKCINFNTFTMWHCGSMDRYKFAKALSRAFRDFIAYVRWRLRYDGSYNKESEWKDFSNKLKDLAFYKDRLSKMSIEDSGYREIKSCYEFYLDSVKRLKREKFPFFDIKYIRVFDRHQDGFLHIHSVMDSYLAKRYNKIWDVVCARAFKQFKLLDGLSTEELLRYDSVKKNGLGRTHFKHIYNSRDSRQISRETGKALGGYVTKSGFSQRSVKVIGNTLGSYLTKINYNKGRLSNKELIELYPYLYLMVVTKSRSLDTFVAFFNEIKEVGRFIYIGRTPITMSEFHDHCFMNGIDDAFNYEPPDTLEERISYEKKRSCERQLQRDARLGLVGANYVINERYKKLAKMKELLAEFKDSY